MSTLFPYIEVPAEMRKIVGEPSEGTRVYRREGSYAECGEWFEAVAAHFPGVSLSPGGVSMFAPVSRAAVNKRLKDGKLTAFTFHVTQEEKSLFGTKRKAKQRPYILLSVAECKAWGAELKRRTGYEEEPDEKEAAEADKFVEMDPKDSGNKQVVYKEPMSREEMTVLIKEVVMDTLANVLPGKIGKASKKPEGKGSK